MKKSGNGLIITGAVLLGLAALSFFNTLRGGSGYDPSGLPESAQGSYAAGYFGFIIALAATGLFLIFKGMNRNNRLKAK